MCWEVSGGDTVVDGSTSLAGIKSGQKILYDGLVLCLVPDSAFLGARGKVQVALDVQNIKGVHSEKESRSFKPNQIK